MKKIISIITIIIFLLGIGVSTVNASSCGISVRASSTSPKIGDTVNVTVSFSVPVGTASFSLNYNSSVLQYVSNTVGGVNAGSSVNVDYIDLVNLSTINSATFTFKVIAAGTANCTVSNITLSDATANPLTVSSKGSATIKVKKVETNTGSSSNNTNTSKPSTSTGSSSSNTNTTKPSTNTGSSSSNTNTSKPSTNTNTTKPSTNTNNTTTSNDKKEDTPTFKKVNQIVYAKSEVNIRASWSVDSKYLGTLKEGDSINRTGTADGWDRVSYNGKTAYIKSGYLTTTKPKKDEDKKENKVENEIVNETTNSSKNEVENTVNNVKNEIVNATENNEVKTENQELTNQTKNDNNKSERDFVLDVVMVIIIIAITIIVVVAVRENRRNRRNRRK